MYLCRILLLVFVICSHNPIQVGAFTPLKKLPSQSYLPFPPTPPPTQNSFTPFCIQKAQSWSIFSVKNTHEVGVFNEKWFKTKLQDLVVLARVKQNLVPVTILSMLNGIITNPTNIQSWILSPNFLGASMMIHLFTAGSMVLNDLYDIKVDAINNPTRPLVKGTITIKEASVFTTILFSLYAYFGLNWIPEVVSPIWKYSLAIVLIYTPILKRIPLVKNLACASIITATVPFVGISINPTLLTDPDLITNWVPLTARTLFTTSMFIELMLDISDRDGDAKNGIKTLPVLFGPQRVVWWLTLCLFINYIQCISLCLNSNTGEFVNIMYGAVIAGNFPLFVNLSRIQNSGFSKQAIKEALFTTTVSMMVFFVIYLVWLRFY